MWPPREKHWLIDFSKALRLFVWPLRALGTFLPEKNMWPKLKSTWFWMIKHTSPYGFHTFHTNTYLISGQDLEGGDDLVCCVCVSRFPGHEVDEGLECDGAAAVGVYYAHDASKLAVTLATEKHQINQRTDSILHSDTQRWLWQYLKVCKTSGPPWCQ